jgi:hypothetical protein
MNFLHLKANIKHTPPCVASPPFESLTKENLAKAPFALTGIVLVLSLQIAEKCNPVLLF